MYQYIVICTLLVAFLKMFFHFSNPLNPIQDRRGGWSLSQLQSSKRQGRTCTGCQSMSGPTQKHNNHAHPQILQGSIWNYQLTKHVCFLECGRKPDYPDRIHACMERKCKLHTERLQLRFKPGISLL